MTTVQIMPVSSEQGDVTFRAIAGTRQSEGKTAGEALDTISTSLTTDERGTLVVVQHFQPDRFFTAEQQKRLEELMSRWRAARDSNSSLSPEEEAELEALIQAEIQ